MLQIGLFVIDYKIWTIGDMWKLKVIIETFGYAGFLEKCNDV